MQIGCHFDIEQEVVNCIIDNPLTFEGKLLGWSFNKTMEASGEIQELKITWNKRRQKV